MIENIPYSAIIPAAGKGSRLSLSFSKELLPVGFSETNGTKKIPKTISSYLIDHFKRSGGHDIHIILREGKADIIDYYKSGKKWGIDISYHQTEVDFGVPFTIDAAYQSYKNKNILFGFPDILFYPEDAFIQMKDYLNEHMDADIVLGLFPVNEQQKWDTVILNENNRIEKIRVKEYNDESVKYAWIIAAWKPLFSDYVHKRLKKIKTFPDNSSKELYMGHIIQLAIDEGLNVYGVPFENGVCLDVGTLEGHSMAGQFISRWL